MFIFVTPLLVDGFLVGTCGEGAVGEAELPQWSPLKSTTLKAVSVQTLKTHVLLTAAGALAL